MHTTWDLDTASYRKRKRAMCTLNSHLPLWQWRLQFKLVSGSWPCAFWWTAMASHLQSLQKQNIAVSGSGPFPQVAFLLQRVKDFDGQKSAHDASAPRSRGIHKQSHWFCIKYVGRVRDCSLVCWLMIWPTRGCWPQCRIHFDFKPELQRS